MEVSLEAGDAAAAARKDDDGRPPRTGTVWTATVDIITAVIGSGVLSLAWAVAQLGWVAGPAALLIFSAVTYCSATLLADCYRTGDPQVGERNYSYMDAVRAQLGNAKVAFCGAIQYTNIVGVAVGYTIAASDSMRSIGRAGCFHKHGHADPCKSSSDTYIYMLLFGAVQILFSQIPNFDQIRLLSIAAAFMSLTYPSIGLSLGIVQTISNRTIKGSLIGAGGVTSTQMIWHTLQALGVMAFAYSFSKILIDIQDTIKAPPPPETKVMKRASGLSLAVVTIFYLLCGCMGYAALGDDAPDHLLAGFGFYEPFWLIDVANIAIVVHLARAYQVACQPIFYSVECRAASAWPRSAFTTGEFHVGPLALRGFPLMWRSAFVCLTTVVAMFVPFFGNVVALLGAVSFWPLTVYFPVEMYIKQHHVPHGSTKWIGLKTLSVACLLVSVAAAVGSIASIIDALKVHRPFSG